MKVAIIGHGKVGRSYHKMFPDAVIYDEPNIVKDYSASDSRAVGKAIYAAREKVNECGLAIVCVPTDSKVLKETKTEATTEEEFLVTGSYDKYTNVLDMSIVEEVVGWLKTPLILIKSALQPGTTDRLVKETGKKIATSVEMVGEGKYFVPYWKYPHTEDPTYHDFLIVGGEEETARACADILWDRMSPDTNIYLVSAIEAEICKLMENTWGAMKVTFGNVMYDICEKLGANYTKVLQAWGADGRVEKMHMRVLPYKRGWKSKCYDKDIPALASLDDSGFLSSMIEVNNKHLRSIHGDDVN